MCVPPRSIWVTLPRRRLAPAITGWANPESTAGLPSWASTSSPGGDPGQAGCSGRDRRHVLGWIDGDERRSPDRGRGTDGPARFREDGRGASRPGRAPLAQRRRHLGRVDLRRVRPDGSRLAAAGLAELGVGRGTRVVLMLRNIPEFHVLDMAVYFCGGTAVSIYNSSSPDQIAYLAGHCEAHVGDRRGRRVPRVLPEGARRAAGAGAPRRAARPRRDDARRRLHLRGPPRPATRSTSTEAAVDRPARGPGHDHLHLRHDRSAQGRDDQPPQHRLDRREPASAASTSTSSPASGSCRYLPMAHIAERMTSHYQQAFLRLRGHVPAPNPGDVAAYAREVRPQLMFGVPRVWEKLHAGVMGALAADPAKKAQFDGAVEAAKPHRRGHRLGPGHRRGAGAPTSSSTPAAFANVRAMLGLDAGRVGHHRRRADPGRAAQVVPGHRRAAGGDLRHVASRPGPMTWTARAGQGRHRSARPSPAAR